MRTLFLLPVLLLIQTPFLPVHADQKLRGIHRSLELDPKTIQNKDTVINIGNLRFLFIGTSNSIEQPRVNSYPYLVARNAAVIDTDDTHASRCAASLLKRNAGDGAAFDVIVVELGKGDSTIKLVKRLRQRYPHSRILILDMWRPIHYHHAPSGMPLIDWMEAQQGTSSEKNQVIQVLQELTHAGEWVYQLRPDEQWIRNQIATVENCALVQPTLPANIHDALDSASFIEDLHTFSNQGHQFIAHIIRQALKDFRPTHNDATQPWEHVDFCENWLHHAAGTTLEHNMMMREFYAGTFALASHGTFDAWIKVVNSDETQMALVIEYLPSSPDYYCKRTRIGIQGQKPVTVGADSRGVSHSLETEQVHVGNVPPGESLVRFAGEPDTKHGKPLRIVGVLLIPLDTL